MTATHPAASVQASPTTASASSLAIISPPVALRLEGAVLAGLALLLYHRTGASWWQFAQFVAVAKPNTYLDACPPVELSSTRYARSASHAVPDQKRP